LFLRSFSDLYQLDADLKIVRIYTSVPGNRLFPGYSFAQGRLGRYLQEDSQPDDFSEIMMGLEDEKPSLYYHIKTPEEEFLARVEISYLTTLLEKMTQFSGIPILLLARDGFVVTSTVPQLGVSTLNPQLTRSDLRHLEIGGRNWAPLFSESRTSGVTVALLIPLRVLELLRNILLFSALFSIVALAVITLLKMRLMDRLMLAPLSAFADRLEQFATGTHPPEPPVKPYRFEELALLDKRFTEMAQTLAEREEGVRNALAQLRESEERFAKAFHSNPAPMVISEINTGRFLDVNAQWLAMLGYTREETLNHTSKELGIWLDPEHRDRVIRN
jgi:PAS domain-containing protein